MDGNEARGHLGPYPIESSLFRVFLEGKWRQLESHSAWLSHLVEDDDVRRRARRSCGHHQGPSSPQRQEFGLYYDI